MQADTKNETNINHIEPQRMKHFANHQEQIQMRLKHPPNNMAQL